MELVRTIPRLGALPELFGFYGAPCHRAETIEYSGGAHYAHDANYAPSGSMRLDRS